MYETREKQMEKSPLRTTEYLKAKYRSVTT